MWSSFPRWSWEHSSYLATGPETLAPLSTAHSLLGDILLIIR